MQSNERRSRLLAGLGNAGRRRARSQAARCISRWTRAATYPGRRRTRARGGSASADGVPQGGIHVVRSGDRLGGLADRYGLSVPPTRAGQPSAAALHHPRRAGAADSRGAGRARGRTRVMVAQSARRSTVRRCGRPSRPPAQRHGAGTRPAARQQVAALDVAELSSPARSNRCSAPLPPTPSKPAKPCSARRSALYRARGRNPVRDRAAPRRRPDRAGAGQRRQRAVPAVCGAAAAGAARQAVRHDHGHPGRRRAAHGAPGHGRAAAAQGRRLPVAGQRQGGRRLRADRSVAAARWDRYRRTPRRSRARRRRTASSPTPATASRATAR